jgi:asparagine synthase (glutamine-hydrolysing)
MCGIAGFFINTIEPRSSEMLVKMTDAVIHRGPDAEGYFHHSGNISNLYLGTDGRTKILDESPNKGLFLGHRRLSIIDLSDSGTQPMSKHGLTLLFNGEIYNYLELREELVQLGIQFTTKTDSEVILSSFHVWREEAFHKFNGMWSIAIFSEKSNTLYLSRDRFGIKPLYYYLDGKKIVFSSEIKQILAYGIVPKINKQVLDSYLLYDITDYNDQTFFQGINSVPPSTICSIQLTEWPNQLKIISYYNLGKDYLGQISVESLIEDSIRLRLRSDVEVGSCLSGGLDSSTIVAFASDLHRKSNSEKPFKTFTTTHSDSQVDETYYSKLVNEFTRTKGIYVEFESDRFLDELENLIYHQEEPFSGFSIYASYKVMQAAANNKIKVLLDGQGGDEVFLGYEVYYVNLLKYLISKGKIIRVYRLFKTVGSRSKLSRLMLIKYFVYFSFSSFRRTNKKRNLNKIKNSNYKLNKIELKDDYMRPISFDNLLHNNLFHRIQHLLKYEDRNSMAFSIETRLPLLDYRLVNEVYKSTPEQLFDDYWLKSILRNVAEKKLPKEVAYRKVKYGFHAPEKELLNKVDKKMVDELLNLDQMQKIFNINKLREMFEKNIEHSVLIKVVLLGMWIKKFQPEL